MRILKIAAASVIVGIVISSTILRAEAQTTVTVIQGGGGNFTSIQGAVTYYHTFSPASGYPLTIEVYNGTYVEEVDINAPFVGQTTSDSVIIREAAGQTAIVDGANAGFILRAGAHDVLIQGFTVTSFTDKAFSLGDASTTVLSCTVDNNIIDVSGVNSNIGVYVKGSSNVVRNNTIMTSGTRILSCGVFIDSATNTLVDNNVITGDIRDDGILVTSSVTTGTLIRRNNLTLLSTGTFTLNGVRLENVSSSTQLHNNMVVVEAGGVGPVRGLYMFGNGSNTDVSHNTIRARNTGSFPAFGVYFDTSSTAHTFRNNIIAVQRGTGLGYCFYKIGSGIITTSSNYNDYFRITQDASTHTGFAGAFNFTTLAAWQAAVTPMDANSTAVDPIFISATNLHVQNLSPVNGLGTPIAGITVDIDGNLRSSTAPDIGADEVTPLAPVNFAVTASSQRVDLSWDPVGGAVGYRVYYGLSSGVYSGTGATQGSSPVSSATNASSLTGLTNMLTYYLAVTAVNAMGLETPLSAERSSTPMAPTVFHTHNRTLVGGLTPDHYRMVSFPVLPTDTNAHNNLAPSLGMYDPMHWRMFGHDPASGTYVELSSTTGGLAIAPGRAFWLISASDVSMDVTGALVDETLDFATTLQPGWNMIGHPFRFPIDWAEVFANGVRIGNGGANGYVDENLWDWVGSYVIASQMVQGRGYWVNNVSGSTVQLRIPPMAATLGAIAPSSKSSLQESAQVSYTPDQLPPPPPGSISSGGGGGGGGGGGCYVTSAAESSVSHKAWMVSAAFLILMLVLMAACHRPRRA